MSAGIGIPTSPSPKLPLTFDSYSPFSSFHFITLCFYLITIIYPTLSHHATSIRSSAGIRKPIVPLYPQEPCFHISCVTGASHIFDFQAYKSPESCRRHRPSIGALTSIIHLWPERRSCLGLVYARVFRRESVCHRTALHEDGRVEDDTFRIYR